MADKLKINQEITLDGKNYKVIGVDYYRLKNVSGNTKEWVSYTLIDNEGNKTWISYGAVKDYFIQWSLIAETEFRKEVTVPANLDLSGIAHVTFEGNPGYSTPTAELIWFDLTSGPYDFVVFERFLRQEQDHLEPMESYYDAGKILKDFKP